MPTLNSIDRLMASLHDTLRQRGHPGLLVQSYVLLNGRIDETVLRTALERLHRCYPLTTSRLVAPDAPEGHWQPIVTKDCPLTVVDLDSDDEAARWRYAERILSAPADSGEPAPVHFLLLRSPGGCDTILLQWDHRLMDGMAGQLLLREVNRLSREPEGVAPALSDEDEVRAYLRRHSWKERLRGYVGLVRSLPLLRPPVRLSKRRINGPPSPTLRIAVRCLDENQTAICTERTRKLLGFANPTPVLLASAFRAVGRVAPRPIRWFHNLCAQVPINLRPPGATQPIFRNLQTYLRMNVRPFQLADRDELTRILQRNLREQLRRGADLGFLWGAERLSRRPRRSRRIMRRFPDALTFVFGYHGTTGPGLESFCGTPVANMCGGIVTAWSPPGFSFSANHYQRRLNLLVCYVAEAVDEATANAFLDELAADLVS